MRKIFRHEVQTSTSRSSAPRTSERAKIQRCARPAMPSLFVSSSEARPNYKSLSTSRLALNRIVAEICRRNTQDIFMANKLIGLVAGIFLGGSATLFAQGGAKPANVGDGTLTIKEKNYPLKNAVAYKTTVDGEDGIAVILSGLTISNEKLNAAMKSEKAGDMPDFRKPYVKLEFTKAGEFKGWGASAGDTSLGRRRGDATGEIKVQDGRAIGKANQPNETEGMFPSGLDVRFDVALLRAGESLPESKKRGPAANVM